MSKIQHLDNKLIDQIAAGEVIESPASVVKELIENAIDSKATFITINIIKGGHELIQVSDNGCGMNFNDIQMAFKRHATSKINSLKDLENITTLGFRGEALPSIASVSMFTAISCDNSGEAHKIIINGGIQESITPFASSKGTVCNVKNIFYNTPARRKFLKKPEKEQAIINEIVRRFMLSHPDIEFKLFSNDKKVYEMKSQSLEDRIISIYGSKYKNNIIPVNLNKAPYVINGFTGNLSILKKRQSEQFIFLNGRYIKNRLLNSSIFSAYQSLIQRGEFPFFVLFINIPTELFDVNVHPAKLEVKFIHEWKIYHALKESITNSLKNILKVIPEFKNSYNFPNYGMDSTLDISFNNNISSYETAPHKLKKNNITNLDQINYDLNNAENKINSIFEESKNIESTHNLETVSDNIWQIHSKYLITEIKSGLIIIDQHVAHERVLFEEAKKAMQGRGFSSQTVLFPQTLKFQPEEYYSLLEITNYLNKIGFRFREFGENTIIIDEIPPDLRSGNESDIIKEIVDQYIASKNTDPTFIDQMAAIYACKSAIKAGDILKIEERIHLIDKLFSTDHPYYCPHGRPIIINLSLNELDQRFERNIQN